VSISPQFSSDGHPYLASERKATAKSIAKYCQDKLSKEGWQRYIEMTHLPHTQAKRGKLGGIAKKRRCKSCRNRNYAKSAQKHSHELARCFAQ